MVISANRFLRAVVIGNAVVDEIRMKHETARLAGGAGLNLAAHLARQGVSAALIAGIGDDPDGMMLTDEMARHGVRLVAQPRLPATARVISHRAAAEPWYEFDAVLERRRVAFTAAVSSEIQASDAVICANFRFDVAEQAEQLAAALGEAPGLRAIDPNPRPRLVADPEAFRRHLERVATRAHLVKVSLEDLEFLYAGRSRDGVRRLIGQGPDVVIVTKGPGGAEAVTSAGRKFHAPAAVLQSPVIDTMGAGDAALAVLLAGAMRQICGNGSAGITRVLSDLDWQGLLEQSMMRAALACRTLGGLPQPG